MSFPTEYRCLSSHVFETSAYKLVPIRYDDRFSIMKWRNEQMYHLRQGLKLTEETQTKYFNNVVIKHFDESYPSQLLFSYLKEGKCIGYGGLVHINWIDKNAELSFIMATELERLDFGCHWANYLNLIEKVAFEEINLHKITTYAFDLRPKLYRVLEKNGFKKEAVLKEHCLHNGKFIDVILHGKRKN